MTIPYTVSTNATAGDVTLTAEATGGKAGTYTAGSFIVSITIPKPSDTSAPVVTPTVTGTKGLGEWYTGDARVQWNVTDAESAITTPECTTTVVTEDTTGTTVSCTATSAGGTTTKSVTIKRDATAPVISGENIVDTAWRNTDLSSPEFTASDALSGLTSPVKFTLTASAQSAGATSPTVVSQTVTDQAGNAATRTLSALIDRAAPTASLTPSGTQGQNGWYRSDVSFAASGTDALSGGVTCTQPEALATDSAGFTASTACKDAAGNSASASSTVKRDATAPAAPTLTANGTLGQNGWYTGDVTFSASSTDALSTATCTQPAALASDSAAHTASTTCTDAAGNTSTGSLSVKRDAAAPTASITPSGTLGQGNWYVSNVTFATSGTDAMSDVNCSAIPVLTADTGGTTVSTTCTDAAGNQKSAELGVKRDATAPVISGENLVDTVWRNSDLSGGFTASDGVSGLADDSDKSFTLTASAESASASSPTVVTRTVRDQAGNSAVRSLSARIDRTKPTASLTPSGKLGDNGWYVGNVSFAASGEDALSGLAGCTPVADLTTDSAGHDASTVCTDRAGNTSTASSTVKRDATAPTVSGKDVVDATWRNTPLNADFTASDDGSGLAENSNTTFTLTASADSRSTTEPTLVNRIVKDQAGNSTVRSLSALIDTVAPTASITPGGTLVNGWYNTDVTFATSGTDALSGGVTCTAIPTLTSDTAGTTVKATCKDAAGNAEDADLGVKRDTAAPTASITPSGTLGLNNWYVGNVSFAASGTDALSGGVSCTPISALTTDSASHTTNSTCTDAAGNSRSAELSVKRDATGPSITGTLASPVIATSVNGATLDSSPLKATDSLSGVSGSLTCTPTALVFGTNAVKCSVQDQAGNPGSSASSVTVTLGGIYSGAYNLLAPLKNNPADLSLVKLSSTVPVKFTAPNYAGGAATDLAPGLKMTVSFRNNSTADTTFEVSDLNSAGSTVWRYDAATNQYIYNLSTKTGFQSGEYDVVITYQGITVARGAFNVKK